MSSRTSSRSTERFDPPDALNALATAESTSSSWLAVVLARVVSSSRWWCTASRAAPKASAIATSRAEAGPACSSTAHLSPCRPRERSPSWMPCASRMDLWRAWSVKGVGGSLWVHASIAPNAAGETRYRTARHEESRLARAGARDKGIALDLGQSRARGAWSGGRCAQTAAPDASRLTILSRAPPGCSGTAHRSWRSPWHLFRSATVNLG